MSIAKVYGKMGNFLSDLFWMDYVLDRRRGA